MALRLQLDPSQLVGAAQQAENAIERVGNEAILAQQKLSRLDDASAYLGRTMTGSAGNMRMLTQQLSQVGQQTMATGNLVQALAIQLPDMGLAFGAVGTAVGLLAGIALPMLWQAFGSTGDAAGDLNSTLNELRASIEDLQGAYDALGNAQDGYARAVKEGNYELAQSYRTLIELQKQALEQQRQQTAATMVDQQAALAELTKTVEEAQAAVDSFNAAGSRRTNLTQGGIFDTEAYAAAASALAEAKRQAGALANELGLSQTKMDILSQESAIATQEMLRAVDASGQLSAGLNGAASSAGGLLGLVARIASAAWSAATAMASWDQPAMQGEDGRGSQRAITQDVGAMRSQQAVQARLAAMNSGGGGGGGSSGGASQMLEPAYWDDLVDSVQAGADAFKEVQDNAKAGAAALTDLFMSAADGADALRQSLSDLLAQLGQVALQNALTSLAGMGGTTGTLFAALGASLTPSYAGGGYTGSGARSGGIDGMGGFPAILHPNETVIDHTTGRGAPMASVSGGTTIINYNIDARGATEGTDAKIARALEANDRQKWANGRLVNGDRRRIS